MTHKNIFLLFGIIAIGCGNVFAVSPYATTIGMNAPRKSFLSAASFPTTAADAPFIARMENKRADYLPYFNRSAFAGLSIKEQDELESMAYRAELQRINRRNTQTIYEYCIEYPYDDTCMGSDGQQTAPTNDVPATDVPLFPTTPPNFTGNLYMSIYLTPENVARYNLAQYNGGCTPPERSNHFNNTILASNKYTAIAPAFEKFMITAFRKEGACVNDPNDRGGYTCFGCASNGLCRGIDMANITRERVEDLAYANIFKKYNVDKIPDAFRGYLLWGMWGSGAVTGIKQFQGALGVPITGKIDDATIYATEHYTGDFAAAYTQNREQFLRNIVARDPSQKKFLKGWLNGLKLLQPSGCHVVPTNPIYR